MRPWLGILAVSLALAAGDADARPPWADKAPRHGERTEEAPSRGAALSLDEAAAQVARETGGRILSAQTVRENGRLRHRIKVLTPDRRVRVVEIDAGER